MSGSYVSRIEGKPERLFFLRPFSFALSRSVIVFFVFIARAVSLVSALFPDFFVDELPVISV